MPLWITISFLSQRYFLPRPSKKKTKKKWKKINKSSGNNASSYYPFRTVNYDKRDRDLRTRARQVTRAVDGRFIDYSSRRKWRGRAGNSGNSSAKLAPSNEPSPSRAPSTFPFPCLVASETNESEPSREKPAETRGTFAAYRVSNLQLEPPKIPPRLYNRDSAIPNFPLSSRASKPTCAINRSRVGLRESPVPSLFRGWEAVTRRERRGEERDQGPASVELGRESGYKLIQKSAGKVLKTRRKVVKPCIFHRPVN